MDDKFHIFDSACEVAKATLRDQWKDHKNCVIFIVDDKIEHCHFNHDINITEVMALISGMKSSDVNQNICTEQ